MSSPTSVVLLLRAFIELIRFEFANATGGFRRVHASVRGAVVSSRRSSPEISFQICHAVTLAACFYWKPVLCLQRAVVTTRLLRRHGIHAEMVIGYRPSPFFSHSWVEVEGEVINDSPVYQQRLLVLERL